MEHRPDLVGMSALPTTTMPRMRAAVEFATETGAGGFAPDAGSAVDVALELIAAS